jgi:CRISPR-associated protein Cmr1
MPQMAITMKAVTPLFLGGARPNDYAELRPPALKGLLRFWYRAIDPGYREHEAALFGGTGRVEGQSAIALRLLTPVQGYLEDAKGYRRSPFQVGTGTKTQNGLLYLGYSLELGGNHRKAIPAGTPLRVGVRATRALTSQEARAVLAAWWLLGHVGSAGSRARRGFGSLSLEGWNGEWPERETLPLASGASTPEEWFNRFEEGLRTILGWFKGQSGQPDHTVLGPGARIYLYREGYSPDKGGTGWEWALWHLGRDMQQFRQRRPPDYDNVKAHLVQRATAMAIKNGAPSPRVPGVTPRQLQSNQTIERAAFGLPLAWRYTSLRDLRPSGTTSFRGAIHDRNASPLFFRAVEIGHRIHPMALLLPAPLLAPNERLREERGRMEMRIPGREILDEFCDSVLKPKAVREVRL